MIMNASDDENISTLLSMGFPDIDEIKKALSVAKNDLNEAVNLLTSYEDIDMKDMSPPNNDENSDENGKGFPLRSLNELETRVFQDNWTIPYKKEESFAKCLSACLRVPADDPHAKKFLERVLPEAFNKLLTSPAVARWDPEVQAGIYDMTKLFMNILISHLSFEDPPINLLDILNVVFDLENDWNNKNKDQDVILPSSPYIRPLPDYGWIRDLLHLFGKEKGFLYVSNYFTRKDINARTMTALLAPLTGCCTLISDDVANKHLKICTERAFEYIRNISDFRSKDVSSVSDLLISLKRLSLRFWHFQSDLCDTLRLSTVVSMLKTPFYNSRMNALKEVSRLIDESRNEKLKNVRIEAFTLTDWMSQNCVLSAAFEGNIDQVQYTDRIRAIVEFLGSELSTDELSKIWTIQETSPTVLENVYAILASAANKFSLSQFEHLTSLIKHKWEHDSYNDRVREKLLAFIGQIGKDAKQMKSTSAILLLLWNVSHSEDISKHLVEKAMTEHLNIINDISFHREATRRKYIFHCVDDIKNHSHCLLSSIKQLHELCKSSFKVGAYHSQKAEKSTLVELNKQHEIVRLLTESIRYSHNLSVKSCSPLKVDSIIDGKYTHHEYIHGHLELMAFFLKEGDLYLSWNHCEDLWNTLVMNPHAIKSDKDTFFNWIQMCLPDLERETQTNFFTKNLLRMDPANVDDNFFNCFKEFFQVVNMIEGGLLSKKSLSSIFIVENLELVGLDYFWQIVMHCELEEIAGLAIQYLLNMSYHHVATNLKRDPIHLHDTFINKCYEMLEKIFSVPEGNQDAVLEGCELETSVQSEGVKENDETATRILTSISVSKVSSLAIHAKGLKLQKIRRIINLAERYISSIEETYNINRSILPHAASFHGRRIKIKVMNDIAKEELVVKSHTNETVGSLKRRIAMTLKKSVDSYTYHCGDVHLTSSKDRCFIGMMDFVDPSSDKFDDSDDLEVIIWTLKPAIREVLFSCPEEPEVIIEDGKEVEKTIPGVVMASGGQIFPMLYKLATLRVGDSDKRMMNGLRRLIHLIPTDPDVSNLIDSFVTENYVAAASPKFSMRKFDPYTKSLSDLFDASVEGMSAFRVLYNLEILSSKLMPTKVGQGPQSRLFAKDFLKIDGVKLILNVLDTLPSDIEYDIRQSVFSIVLQLSAFLLCGQTVVSMESSVIPTPPKKSAIEVEKSPPPPIISSNQHSFMLRTMSEHSFKNTISRLMKIIWAASAGKLNLASSSISTMNRATISENVLYSDKRRSRESSTGSSSSEDNASSSSSSSFGIVVVSTSKFVSVLDAQIASDAFELLVTSLSLRIHEITLFYDLPLVDEFIVDTVLGSPSRSVRQKARDQLIRFSKIPYVRRKIFSSDNSNGPIPSPKSFLTQVLLKTPVPLWMPSCKARGTSHIILSQCSEYFELRCSLMRDLTLEDQKTLLSEPASQMLDDELSFLYNYTPCHRLSDCNLLAGHLKLVEALLTCDGVNKARIGEEIIKEVLNSFLFPASRIIVDDSNSSRPINPKCDTRDSRIAAYQLLIELTKGCPSNMKIISDELIVLHHQSHHHRDDIGKDFEYEPDVERRKEFVGLKNAGATCYMNSVLQQLYSIPGIADAILSENKDEDSDKEEESIFHQLQVVFGYLLESKLKFYSPETFWKCFKLFGRPVNVREQQDAFEFFTQIVSQVDDYLSLNKRNKVFAPRLEGIFSDQKICQGCPHRYEREQMFTALNLPVTTNNLVESLDQFVKGELLEGDNAYYCEKCGTKRNAIKRMCIRSCPSTLVIQLKRFHYDWESNRALKFDDYFQFPMKLDMGPYTSDGIRQKNKNDKKKKATSPCSILYDLCGVVVHSGQASAGHYYSFVRKRKSNGKWYKFNDTTVEEFELNEESLVAECFGGNYTEKKSSHLPEERLRYWNAYMLFYEARKPLKRMSKKKSSSFRNTSVRFSSLSASQSPGTNAPLSAPPLSRESFSHLNDLLEHGERSGLFSQSLKMPNSIERSIREKNLKFLRDRDLFCPEYFKFVQDLIKINSCEVQSVKLAVHFLFNGYLHLKRRDSDLIQGFIRTILSQSSDSNSSLWLLQYLANHQQLFRLYLLECPCKSIRTHFSNIVYHVISSRNDQVNYHKEILSTCSSLVDQDASNHSKDSKNLFWLLWKYSQLGLEHCQDLFESGTFRYTVKFLLGMDPLERNLSVITRKWSSSQIREFSELHSLIALLIHICDTSPFISFASSPQLREQSFKFRMPESVQSVLYGDLAPMYVREVVTAVRENIGDPEHLSKMLLGSSYCCERFSFILLEELLKQYSNVNSSELKHLSNLIIDLLDIEDFLQFKRIKYVIEGDSSSDGFLSLIPIYRDSDSRRAYQCIKTLVNSANKSSHVKNFLLIEETAEKWEEAVRWLQSRMVDFNGNGGASGGESSNISTSSYPVSTVLPSSSSTIVSSTSEPVSDIFSNEDSSTRTFRRTTSAQVTLEEANALMAHYGSTSNMEIEEEHMKTDEEC